MGGAMIAALSLLAACTPSRPAVPYPAAVPAPYRIGPGDVLDIVVWKEDTVSGAATVRSDGMISVALVGDVTAQGLTPEELAEALRGALTRFIDNPNVVVRVTASARSYYIVGNVRSPGTYALRADLTLVQALAVAGGFTEFADRDEVRIIRQGGFQNIAQYDYDAIVSGEIPDVRIEANDTIIIP